MLIARLLSVCCLSTAICLTTAATRECRAEPAELWSLAQVARVTIPQVKRREWPANPIDCFILAALEAHGMEPAPAVTPQQLVRRVYFDLTGLPPSPDEVREFTADPSAAAYERLVDRLLASPLYGERWARFWLDIARFAETNGYERDALKPNAWKYRDWVVRSLNTDKAYDRFVLEQLAGDELPDASEETRTATGFLRVGTFDDEPNDPLKYKYEQLDDLIHATGTAFLALTLKCARCHDHKFDPVPQTDYYAVLNFFIGGRASEGELLGFTDQGRDAPPVKLLAGGDPTHEADVVPPGFPSLVPALARAVAPPPPGALTTTRRLQFARWIVDPRNPLTPRVLVNRLWQHHFGEGLVRTPDNFGTLSDPPTHPELLDWLAGELIEGGWRVKRLHKMIVLSSAYHMDSNHPREEEFNEHDFANRRLWRANRRRLEAEALRDAILATSGELNPRPGGPSFFPSVGKEALEGLSKKDAAWGTSPLDEQNRRTIYMMTKRSLLLPLVTTFDFADTTQPCCRRSVSTVAPQALALLNNDFVHQQSERFAERVAHEAGIESDARIDRAWWLALSREPVGAERAAALAHLASQHERFVAAGNDAARAEKLALASLCHVLLNTNEFIYID